MTTNNQKNQILESLDSLDQRQAEKVLEYIKGLQLPTKAGVEYQKFKREALKEIRQALGQNRKLTPSF